MKTTNVLTIALVVALVCGKAQATSITAVGLDTTTGGAWRGSSVAKPLDFDGNNVYGSAGYLALNTGNTGSFVGTPTTTNTLNTLPAWLTVTYTGVNSAYSAGYGLIDNPTGPGTIHSGFSWDNATPANTNTELLKITVSAARTFRLGVFENGGGNELQSYTLKSGAVSATQVVNDSSSNAFHYAFFDVTANAGDVLSLQVFSTTGGNVGLSGLTIDVVPEPSSVVLAGSALAAGVGIVVRRNRSVRCR